MSIRPIKKSSKARPTMEGAGVHLHRVFGFGDTEPFDPFLMMDDFRNDDPQQYQNGFPWHPHRGIETITYVLKGTVDHGDSLGNVGTLGDGDVQWMTTGSGLIHSELVTEKFKKSGGIMQGLQIWVNLPQKNKKVKPWYQHIKKNNIPSVTENTNIEIKVLVGEINGTKSKVQTYSPVSIFDIQFTKPDMTKFNIDKEQNLMIYIIDGQLQFNEEDKIAHKGDMIYFDQSSDEIQLTSISEKGSYLVLAGKPLKEPVARYGPFVANTEGEIKQAMMDYQEGKMGSLA